MTDHPATVAPLGTSGTPTLQDWPRIYVACLAAYNAGRLHGRWIDATTPNEIRAEARAMLAASPEPGAEEHAIHGATRKSHLLSEAGMPLVEPSRPFLTGACELGNRLVRSLRQRAGSWQ
ncbi:MAG: antirestriction protein ArdA, partial [Hyphomonas sp.]|uniref:antirestriction protein ArdA n=1 Tax=Hyphomonas sp. TaxID=87 RepID=UPI0017DA9EB5